MAGQITVHAFDAELMFRTTGDLTANASLGPKTVWGGIRAGLAAQVVIPTSHGINDTIYPKVYTSVDGSTYNLVAQYAGGSVKVPRDGLALIVPFPVLPGKNYVKLELVGTAASTTYNFGAVVAGIIPNPGHDYDRTNHFTL